MPFSQVLSDVFGGRNLPAPYGLLANYVGPPSIHLYWNGTADLTIANTLVEGFANVMISILYQRGASLNGAPALGTVFGM
jgi:hypothetical protein